MKATDRRSFRSDRTTKEEGLREADDFLVGLMRHTDFEGGYEAPGIGAVSIKFSLARIRSARFDTDLWSELRELAGTSMPEYLDDERKVVME